MSYSGRLGMPGTGQRLYRSGQRLSRAKVEPLVYDWRRSISTRDMTNIMSIWKSSIIDLLFSIEMVTPSVIGIDESRTGLDQLLSSNYTHHMHILLTCLRLTFCLSLKADRDSS